MHSVKNTGKAPRFFNEAGGKQRMLQPGEKAEFELADRDSVVIKALEKDGKVSISDVEDAKEQRSGDRQNEGLIAKHRGAGRYSVMDGDTEVMGGLSKDDAEAFNALSAEDKAAYVKKA